MRECRSEDESRSGLAQHARRARALEKAQALAAELNAPERVAA